MKSKTPLYLCKAGKNFNDSPNLENATIFSKLFVEEMKADVGEANLCDLGVEDSKIWISPGKMGKINPFYPFSGSLEKCKIVFDIGGGDKITSTTHRGGNETKLKGSIYDILEDATLELCYP